jgi:hypothetical protein
MEHGGFEPDRSDADAQCLRSGYEQAVSGWCEVLRHKRPNGAACWIGGGACDLQGQPRNEAVRKHADFGPFCDEKRSLAKTGSGQTHGKLNKTAFFPAERPR